LRTGGLGQKIILDPYTGASQFDTWVCHYSHRCARRAGSVDTPFDHLTPMCQHCALDAFIYDAGASMTKGCHNCACGDGSRMCGCVWCPDIIPDASFFPAGTIDGTAVTAAECHQSCFRAGYGHESCGTGTGLLNEYFNGGNALSCVAACMMRVGGRLPLDSAGSEEEACHDFVAQIASEPTCEFEISGRLYNVCAEGATCPVPPSLESGHYGCQIGAVPNHDQIDPFCWVYNEKCGKFEPWGWASTIGLD
jgi:hypothetical protein